MTQTPETPPPTPKSRIAAWFFWGTITVMTLGTLALQVAGSQNAAPAASDVSKNSTELLAEKFRAALEGAPDEVLQQVLPKIDPLLDKAFQPVVDRIEGYTDFHYSIRGEYTELVVAVAGSLEADLETRLFDGLSDRLKGVSAAMDQDFASAYERELGKRISAASNSVDLGEAMRRATQDAIARVKVTAPAAAATTVAGAISLKVISKTVAKKVAAKVAAKAAAKGLFKGGSVLGGAGAGAAICSPSGPVAAACGIAGGVIAWFTVDAVVIGLDEVLNRDEFERELRASVDAEKRRISAEMKQNLQIRRLELVRLAPRQAQDMTLAQLSQPQRAGICDEAALLIQNYRLIQTQIAARSPENLATFAADLDKASQRATLRPLADDMRRNLGAGATLARASRVRLAGNFRTEDRGNREVTAQLRIQGHSLAFEPSTASKDDGFNLFSPVGIQIDLSRDIGVRAALEQHLRIRSNRFFGGTVTLSGLPASLNDANGMKATLRAPLPIMRDKEAKSLDQVNQPDGPSSELKLTMPITAETLPDVVPPGPCTTK